MRGGTSKGLFFHSRDLPKSQRARNKVLLGAMGSPDVYRRQLDGMGGGISSLSKVVIVSPPSHPNADLDYTFGQVAVDMARIDWNNNCGNLSSGVGPFAVEEGLVNVDNREAELCLHNTNTGRLINARFAVADGYPTIAGNFEVQGVSGFGAPIELCFKDPGGATCGNVLPSQKPYDSLDIPGIGTIDVSLIDATTPCVFFKGADIGLSGTEMPDELESKNGILEIMEKIRKAATVAMKLPKGGLGAPKVGFVAPPLSADTLSGSNICPDSIGITARMISMGKPHRALPLTGAMCLAAATKIRGSVVNEVLGSRWKHKKEVPIGHPSGIVTVTAEVIEQRSNDWYVSQIKVKRTARRLMEGRVMINEDASRH